MPWFSHHPPFTIRSDAPLSRLARAMDNRFWGLPSFHRSVQLTVKEIRRLRDGVRSNLEPSKRLVAQTQSRLQPRLLELIDLLNEAGGRRSLQLLRFKVGLAPEPAVRHFREYAERRGRLVERLIMQLVGTLRVPIAMVVGSSFEGGVYQSHAVGVRGVTNYRSAIVISRTQQPGQLLVEGGLEAAVEARHLDHSSRLLARAIGLPDDVINEYIQQHLYPERPQIMRRLCDYVLTELQRESGEAGESIANDPQFDIRPCEGV